MPNVRVHPICAFAFCLTLFAARAEAQVVTGVADKTIYADRVTFRVQSGGGLNTATLNGVPVPTDVDVVVDAPDYYDLVIDQNGTPSTVRFVVRASERASTEVGLPPWTPFPMIPSADAEFTGAQLKVVAPQSYPRGMEIPVIAIITDGTAEENRFGVNGFVRATGFPDSPIRIFRGVGSSYLPAATAGGDITYEAGIGPLRASKTINIESSTTWTQVSGSLSSSATWGANSRIRITGTLTVAQGAVLTIGAGSVIAMGAGVDIRIDGKIVVNPDNGPPVVFAPETRTAPWGGFIFWNKSARAEGEFKGTIFTGSGANLRWFDDVADSGGSHRREQALLYLNNAKATLTDSYLIDGKGQGGHGEGSALTMTRCLVQRFTTTGQYNGGSVTLDHTALIEFPSADASFVDGDNDAMYLTGTGAIHKLTKCLIGWTLDDGVDAGGAGPIVTFDGCWFESTYHEGLALSADGTRNVNDTVAINCGQGIECGFNSLTVNANHCLSTANLTGARFGDCYDWTYSGTLNVKNDSLLIYNRKNIWGMTFNDWLERIGPQMVIEGNFLSAFDPKHPNNNAWQPEVNAGELLDFLGPTPPGTVGIGIAERAGTLDISQAPEGVPVRLSIFSVNPVSVAYRIDSESGRLGGGTLRFDQGETLKVIPIDVPDPGSHSVILVTLSDPLNAEITGLREVAFVKMINLNLFPAGSRWKYHDKGVDLGTGWRAPAYDDGSWLEGPAELGFGDGGEKTAINGGPSDARFPTVYFRRKFEVEDPSRFAKLGLRLLRDDGAVIYVNGTEVLRSNMPEGAIGYSTWSSTTVTGSAESTFFSLEADPAPLVAGTNTIAVEIHQSDAGSSDLSFDLELNGLIIPTIPSGGFVRGDSNGDGSIDISDAIAILFYLFAGVETDCADSLDANDKGDVDLSDVVYILDFMFLSGPPMPPPFPGAGEDPTTDGLDCSRL